MKARMMIMAAMMIMMTSAAGLAPARDAAEILQSAHLPHYPFG